MGRLRIPSAALALTLVAVVAAATAEAKPQRVARGEAFGTPILASGEVVYPGLSASSELEVRRVRPDANVTVIARMGKPATAERRPFVVLAGSATHLAADRITSPDTDVFRITETLVAGPLEGPLNELDFHCPLEANRVLSHDGDQPAAIDGTRLAFVREACANGTHERRVVIRDLTTGMESGGLPTSGVGVALAGRYVAFLDPLNSESLQVYDLDQGSVAYPARARNLEAFDLEPDGKLVVSAFEERGCEGIVSWYSPAEPTPHPVDSCNATGPVAIDDDRIAYAIEGRLRVAQIGGDTITRRLPVDPDLGADGVLPFDGERVAFATPGCSRDTGAVWVAAVADADTSMPRPRPCRVVWSTRGLRLDRRNRLTLRVSCPNGCRGDVYIEGRGERRFGSAHFEEEGGGSGRVRIPLRRASRLFGRARTVTATLHTFRDTTGDSDFGEDTQRVTLRR